MGRWRDGAAEYGGETRFLGLFHEERLQDWFQPVAIRYPRGRARHVAEHGVGSGIAGRRIRAAVGERVHQ
jgi:hypothetical protein